MDFLDKNIDELYWRLIREYEESYPNEDSPANAKRYFKQAKLIEILELAFGRKIKFSSTYPLQDDQGTYDIEVYDFEYLGTLKELSLGQSLIKKFYDLAIPYAHKFEYEGHPITYRDIIGIEKTIDLLEKANNRYIEVICNATKGQEIISPDYLEFIILEDDEWYDFETGQVKTDDELNG